MDLERISKAFYLGYLWSLGRRFAMDRAMAMDAKRDLRDVRWVTINGTHVPISKKTGKPIGRWRDKFGRDKIKGKVNHPRKDVKVGRDAYEIALDEIAKDFRSAIEGYTKDGYGGLNHEINNFFRKGKVGKLTPEAQKVVDDLDRLFDASKGITDNIRVYRGIPRKVAREISKTPKHSLYEDSGFCSTSYDLDKAIEYAKDRALLVIDLPKGYKAVSLEKLSKNPQDKEILLLRNARFKPTSYNSKSNSLVIHLRAEL